MSQQQVNGPTGPVQPPPSSIAAKVTAVAISPNRWLSQIVSIAVFVLVAAANGADTSAEVIQHIHCCWLNFVIAALAGGAAGQLVTVGAAARELHGLRNGNGGSS